MSTRYFCTLFDANYLLKGVAMLRSLREHSPNSHVFVLCMDSLTHRFLSELAIPEITLLKLDLIESPDLLAIKPTRSVAEYCWTLSPALPYYVLENYAHVEFVTYLDADLYFYSSVEPLYSESKDASIVIIEHRLIPQLKHLEVNGRFCVEWVGFRRSKPGLECLKRWRAQCVEWCFHRLEGDRMGDQKYLDPWPSLFRQDLHILRHPGAGLAPWNYAGHRFSGEPSESIKVDGSPLIFYHFHQLQLLSNGKFDRLSKYYTQFGREPEAVYQIYETRLRRILEEVRQIDPSFSSGIRSYTRIKSQRLALAFLPEVVKRMVKRVIRAV